MDPAPARLVEYGLDSVQGLLPLIGVAQLVRLPHHLELEIFVVEALDIDHLRPRQHHAFGNIVLAARPDDG